MEPAGGAGAAASGGGWRLPLLLPVPWGLFPLRAPMEQREGALMPPRTWPSGPKWTLQYEKIVRRIQKDRRHSTD